MSWNNYLHTSTPLTTTNDEPQRSPFAKFLSVAQSLTPSILSSLTSVDRSVKSPAIVPYTPQTLSVSWQDTAPLPASSTKRPLDSYTPRSTVSSEDAAASETSRDFQFGGGIKSFATNSKNLSSSLGVISTETRRLLRKMEMERRTSPQLAAKKMKLDSNFDTSSTGSIFSEISRPPTVLLNTPYQAKVLPRLATLRTAPYSRPVQKEMVDKGTSVNFLDDLQTNGVPIGDKTKPSPYSRPMAKAMIDKGVSVNFLDGMPIGNKSKSAAAMNKFSARLTDLDEGDDYPDNHNLDKITLPFSSSVALPKPGFLSGVSPSSPKADSFQFSHPIVVASPTDIHSPDISPEKPFVRETPQSKWTCNTCFISNSQDLSKCQACSAEKLGAKKPLDAFKSEAFVKKNWSCTTCFISNPADQINCLACQAVKPGTVVKPKWTCETCFISNQQDLTKCQACSADKPSSKPSESYKADVPVKRNWTCTTCYITNQQDLSKCQACSADRSGTKSSDPFKSDTSFVKKNWSCTTCFVTNPNDQIKCLACRSVKPGTHFKSISFGFQEPAPAVVPKIDPVPAPTVERVQEQRPVDVTKPVEPIVAPKFIDITEPDRRTEPKSVRFADPPVSLVKSISVESDSQVLSSSAPPLPTSTTVSTSFGIQPTFGFNPPSSVSLPDVTKPAVSTGAMAFGFQPTSTLTSSSSVPSFSSFASAPKPIATSENDGFKFVSATSKPSTFAVPSTTSLSSGGFSFGTLPTSSAPAPLTTTAGVFSLTSSASAPKLSSTSDNDGFGFMSAVTKPSTFSIPVVSTGGFSFGTFPTSTATSIASSSVGGFSFPTIPKVSSSTDKSGGFTFGSGLSDKQPSFSTAASSTGFNFGITSSTVPSTSSSGMPSFSSFASASKQVATSENEGFGFVSATIKASPFAIPSTTGSTSVGFNFGAMPTSSTAAPPTTTAGGFSFTSLVPGAGVFGSQASQQPASTAFPPQISSNPFSIATGTNKSATTGQRKILAAKRKAR